ncbi:MAG TPA: hypothetical protein VLI07_05625 [Candidatus Binatus sp.]|nr:hypothetical protein [Candidatus Binatus sp.]
MARPEMRAEPVVREGICYVLFAYDAGLAIDLDESERRITALKQRASIRHKHRAPKYFDYRPPPLRVTQEGTPISVGTFRTTPNIDAVLYDFGAVSVAYQVPLQGPLGRLVNLSDELYENEALSADARRWVERLLTVIHPAVRRAELADFVETYVIFEIADLAPTCSPEELYTSYAREVAQILRAERAVPSDQEVGDALTHRISFSAEDVTFIDWDAALILDRDAEDVRAVLEFANVELLEMRFLDQRLDDALDESYERLSRRPFGFWQMPGSARATLRRIGQLQVENAVLFEGVNNALKLLGDQYLARVYRLVSERFHLAEWDASILRKIQTLESIYQKVADQAANRRTEVLEWIIIVLIAVEIVLPFLPRLAHLR